jgi:hypothetical protein
MYESNVMEEMRNEYIIPVGKPQRSEHVGEDEKIILIPKLRETGVKVMGLIS